MNMRKYYGLKVFCLAALAASSFTSCKDDDDDTLGNWVERSSLNGKARSSAVSFVIDNNGYIGTGYDGDDYRQDFWAYDVDGDYWVQKADFPGTARSAAVGFELGGDGYIGSGYDGTNELADFYKYDVSANSWSQIATFPENPRRGAVAFANDSYGFFGTGYDGDNYRKDFWKYNPANDSWTEVYGFGGDKRMSAATFTIDGKAYLGTGVANDIYLDDFWAFDMSSESWTRLNDLDEEDDYDVIRSNAASFSLNGYGYVACGVYGSQLSSVWEYDPLTDTWEEKTGFEKYSRRDPVSFSTGTRGFVLLGRNGTSYYDDMEEFYPFEEYDDED